MKKIYLIFVYCALAILHNAYATTLESRQDPVQGKEYPDRVNGVYDASLTNADIQKFLDFAKKSVITGNPKIIAGIFAFPFWYHFKKKRLIVKSKEEFIKNYDKIMNRFFVEAILKADINELFSNCQGIMIGNGEIWFDPRRGIITLNAKDAWVS